MKKKTLNEAVEKCKDDTKNALQTVYDSLNHGQQKQIVKNQEVKRLFDLYGVDYT
jgi:ribosomal protein S20